MPTKPAIGSLPIQAELEAATRKDSQLDKAAKSSRITIFLQVS